MLLAGRNSTLLGYNRRGGVRHPAAASGQCHTSLEDSLGAEQVRQDLTSDRCARRLLHSRQRHFIFLLCPVQRRSVSCALRRRHGSVDGSSNRLASYGNVGAMPTSRMRRAVLAAIRPNRAPVGKVEPSPIYSQRPSRRRSRRVHLLSGSAEEVQSYSRQERRFQTPVTAVVRRAPAPATARPSIIQLIDGIQFSNLCLVMLAPDWPHCLRDHPHTHIHSTNHQSTNRYFQNNYTAETEQSPLRKKKEWYNNG